MEDDFDYETYMQKQAQRKAPKRWNPLPGTRVFVFSKKPTSMYCTGVVLDFPVSRTVAVLSWKQPKKKKYKRVNFYKVMIITHLRGKPRRTVRSVREDRITPAPQQILRKHLLKLCLDSLYCDCVV